MHVILAYSGGQDLSLVASNALVCALLLTIAILGVLVEMHTFHGVAGTIGVVSLASLIAIYVYAAVFNDFPTAFTLLETIAIAVLLTFVLFLGFLRFFPESPFLRRIALHARQNSEYVASRSFEDLLGKHGTSDSLLRPAGVATIEGQRVRVLTEGNFILAGTPICVTRVEGPRIFVKAEKE